MLQAARNASFFLSSRIVLYSRVIVSFDLATGLLRQSGNPSAVHEHDLPDARPFLQEARFQPFLVRGAAGVGDAAFIEIDDPSGVAADVDVRFGYVQSHRLPATGWALMRAMMASPLNRVPPPSQRSPTHRR